MAQSITPKERVIRAIAHQESDICPYYIWIDPKMVGELADYYKTPEFPHDYIESHLLMNEVASIRTPLDDGTSIDEFGVVWRLGNIPHVEKPALDGPSLAGYTFPDISTDEHFAAIPDWASKHKDKFRVVQFTQMFLARAFAMRGFENLMMDFIECPEFVDELLGHLEEVGNKLIDRLLYDFGDCMEAIGFADDYGAQRAMLISPNTWRQIIKPHLSRVYERVKKGGKYVYVHSCGHVTPIIPDLIEMGMDLLQPLQPEAMDIFAVKRDFGRDACLVGGISTQYTLPYGTPDDVRREVQKCLELMAPGGGYVMAPAKAIMPGVPLANSVALIDTMLSQPRRPCP